MSPPHITFENTPDNIAGALPQIMEAYERDGVAILPKFFSGDHVFESLVADLKVLTGRIAHGEGLQLDPGYDLSDQITALAGVKRSAVGALYDIGTRPNKLLSGMLLKLHPALLAMTRAAFKSETPVIATPALSDTLHIFPPGADSFRFNLPIHQDYPYLLQSPNQITFWISLSKKQPDAGGMTVWCGSHKLGIRPQRRDANNHLECVIDDVDLSKFKEVKVEADYGDVVVFHSNILHRSEKNFSIDKTRIVQLFRYSDLSDNEARRIGFVSADMTAKAKRFEELYPDLILDNQSMA